MDLHQCQLADSQSLKMPKAGEIWEIGRSLKGLFLDKDEQLRGRGLLQMEKNSETRRLAMIVNENPGSNPYSFNIPVVTVMLLSQKIEYLSNADILLPKHLTKLNLDLIGETWHILPLLVDQLIHQVGERLSRQAYDALLTIGDAYYDSGHPQKQVRENLKRLGLQIGQPPSSQVQQFHQQEQDWGRALLSKTCSQWSETQSLTLTEKLLEQSILLEQDLMEVQDVLRCTCDKSLVRPSVALKKWFEGQCELGWHQLQTMLSLDSLNFGIAFRSSASYPRPLLKEADIQHLLNRLQREADESQRQSILNPLLSL